MTINQVIHHVNEMTFDDDISIVDTPKGYFPAVTSNNLPGDGATREIRVDLLPLDQSPGGKMDVNSGLFVKGADETAVRVVVYQDDQQVAENTASY